MMRLLFSLLVAAGLCSAADVKFAWVGTSNVVNVLAGSAPDSLQYGAEILLDSDNPNVTEFQIALVVQLSNGEIVTRNETAVRSTKPKVSAYGTAYTIWIGGDAGYQVLSLDVRAVVGKRATRPVPGQGYSSDTPAATTNQ